MNGLTVLLLSLVSTGFAQITFAPADEILQNDEHLHTQIPAPSRQPTEEELKEELSNQYESIDENKDQLIDSLELRNRLDVVHKQIIAGNVDRQWSYYQPVEQEIHSWEGYAPEMKEALSWEEYKRLTFPDELMEDSPSNPHYKSMTIMLKRSENRWKQADENSDTVITKKEFANFIHPEESDKHKEILVEEAIGDMDTNKDGSVSLDEYMHHMTEMTEESDRAEPDWAQTQQNQFVTYLDKNKDGSLERDEIKDWLIPPYDKHEAESWRLITLADSNQDSKLTLQEILDKYQQFYVILTPDFWAKFGPEHAQQQHDEL